MLNETTKQQYTGKHFSALENGRRSRKHMARKRASDAGLPRRPGNALSQRAAYGIAAIGCSYLARTVYPWEGQSSNNALTGQMHGPAWGGIQDTTQSVSLRSTRPIMRGVESAEMSNSPDKAATQISPFSRNYAHAYRCEVPGSDKAKGAEGGKDLRSRLIREVV